ncbi:MAG: tetratricopeptide repeat protein, partial [Alphaproteobacteria bacterium]
MLIKFGAAFIAVTVLISAAPSWGDFNRDLKICQNHRAKSVARVRSCTRVIQSKSFDGKDLALILILRANAFDDRGETDRAIQDYGAAIRLNPRDSRA